MSGGSLLQLPPTMPQHRRIRPASHTGSSKPRDGVRRVPGYFSVIIPHLTLPLPAQLRILQDSEHIFPLAHSAHKGESMALSLSRLFGRFFDRTAFYQTLKNRRCAKVRRPFALISNPWKIESCRARL